MDKMYQSLYSILISVILGDLKLFIYEIIKIYLERVRTVLESSQFLILTSR